MRKVPAWAQILRAASAITLEALSSFMIVSTSVSSERDSRAHQQREAGEAAFVLFLHQLVVESTAAEPRRQNAFHDVDHLTANQGHAFARQFAETVDVSHVVVVAEAVQGAATAAFLDNAVVVHFGIQENLGRGQQEGGDIERVHFDLHVDAGHAARKRQNGEGIRQNVQVVAGHRLGAPHRHTAGFDEAIRGVAGGAGGADAGDLGGRRGFARDDENGAGEIDSGVPGGDRDAEGAADGGVDLTAAVSFNHLPGPARDPDSLDPRAPFPARNRARQAR